MKYIYICFDRFNAVNVYKSGLGAIDFIVSESNSDLSGTAQLRMRERLIAGETVYICKANSNIRAVRAPLRD